MADQTADVRMKRPTSPGSFIRAEVIDSMDLSVSVVATTLDITQVDFCAVLDGRAPISPELAIRIEDTFGISKDTLMRMQESYELSLSQNDS